MPYLQTENNSSGDGKVTSKWLIGGRNANPDAGKMVGPLLMTVKEVINIMEIQSIEVDPITTINYMV